MAKAGLESTASVAVDVSVQATTANAMPAANIARTDLSVPDDPATMARLPRDGYGACPIGNPFPDSEVTR